MSRLIDQTTDLQGSGRSIESMKGTKGARMVAMTPSARTNATARARPDIHVPTPGWLRSYGRVLRGTDLLAVVAALLLATRLRFGDSPGRLLGLSYYEVGAVLAGVWLFVLAASRAYESRFLGTGSEEFRRVFHASLYLVAVVAFASYALKLEVARGYIAIALPAGTVFLLVGRYTARKALHRRRRDGRWSHRVLVIGGGRDIAEFTALVRRDSFAGFHVAGSCRSDAAGDGVFDPLVVLMAADALAADTIAVAGSTDRDALRRLAWSLEGTGISLVVAPGLTDVAGPRLSIRPVAGLPLLHVEEPELSGGRQVLKDCVERSLALGALVMLLPLLVIFAVAISLGSRGPALFSQRRVGRYGREFTVYKFRTMYADAEALLTSLLAHNECDGPLFKMRRDPRITALGRLLRRFSLDELPQLWNVVRGDMALVGPRPPLPTEVGHYEHDVRRRLLVKPGLTGLWQVSGRSDLSWEESVRLDLYYVENWSLALDAMVIWKTLFAVAKGRGAY